MEVPLTMKTLITPWIINQGSSFYEYYGVYDDDGNPLAFTGYSAFGEIREDYDSAIATVSMTIDSGRLNLHNGVLTVHLLPADTKNLDADTDYVFDIELVIPGGDRFRIVEGVAIVRPEVSKED
jgi:hypothetical protein